LVKMAASEFKDVEVGLIDPPGDVVRVEIAEFEIRELAESIKEQGLLQPIVLNTNGKRFEIIAGHRRFLAVQVLGWKKIMAKVVKMAAGKVALARATENIQRHDLTAFEEGMIYQDLEDKHKMNIDQIAKRMGKSAGVVKRRMEILKMPESLRRAIHQRTLSLTVAEELQGCLDEAHREYLTEMAIEHGVTKEVARMLVQDWRKTLRTDSVAGIGGGLDRNLAPPEVIYRPCDACHGPVDLSEGMELRLCQECGAAIKKALEGKRDGES